MLLELWSDRFSDAGAPRHITFRKGLNTVRGGERAENSIGKSTFLSIIDFAFGGSDFLDSTAAIMEPYQTIYFTYKFGKGEYTFSRSVETLWTVHKYENRQAKKLVGKLSLDEFNEWLKEQYGLEYVDIDFNTIIRRFFRIQNRAVGIATQPLRADLNEAPSVGVAILERLFGVYDEIISLEQPYVNADKELRALNKVRDRELITVVQIKTDGEYRSKTTACQRTKTSTRTHRKSRPTSI